MSRGRGRDSRNSSDRHATCAEETRCRQPRFPSDLETALRQQCLKLADQAAKRCEWLNAFRYAELAQDSDPQSARLVMADAAARQAKRLALCGRFGEARQWASNAVILRPNHGPYQDRRRLIEEASRAVLRDLGTELFEDTTGSTPGYWWESDLLGRVRGRDDGDSTVASALIIEEINRDAVENVYAVGTYQPWHVAGPVPLFTRYVRALKQGGRTIRHAAVLLRQGLVEDTEWIEDVDALVPVPTSELSFEARDFELTEELTRHLGAFLCAPVVDAFERSPDCEKTHLLGSYAERRRELERALIVKKTHSKQLHDAAAVLVVDDVVTYGTTFEVCALKLKAAYPHLRVYGVALAYTETPQRHEQALRERELKSP